MRCRSVLTRIDAMRTGELHSSEEETVREHLGRCRSCGESVDDLDQLASGVKALAVAPSRFSRDRVTAAIADSFDVIRVNDRTVFVAFGARGIRMVQIDVDEADFRALYAARIGRELKPGSLDEKLRRQVIAAMSGQGVPRPLVDLAASGEFERQVLEILTTIPRGEVRTYAWVAERAGKPKAVRAVGNICARNVVPFVVPCHRVVPTSGGIGNYAFGSPLKRTLLEREGAPVEEIETLSKEGIRFVGSKTTKIYCCPTCRDARRIQEKNRVAFKNAAEAASEGFRPCKHCHPAAA